jgi:hypothetical protein
MPTKHVNKTPIQIVLLVKCHFNKCLLTSYSLATRHSNTIAKMPLYQVLTGPKWRRQYLTEDKRFCRWQEGKKNLGSPKKKLLWSRQGHVSAAAQRIQTKKVFPLVKHNLAQ